MRFTSKQREILNALKKFEYASVYEIIDEVGYEVNRDAMLHSIRVLIENGVVERYGRVKNPTGSYMNFKLTDKGESLI